MEKRKLAYYSFLFFLLFILIGDTYILFADNKINSSDFVFQTDVKNVEKEKQYIASLVKHSKRLDLRIYALSKNVKGKNVQSYTVFCETHTKNLLMRRLQIRKDKTVIRSLVSGKRTIEFMPLEAMADTPEKEWYYVFGAKANVEKLRSLTIDEYGTGKPEDNNVMDDAVFLIILSAWVFVFVIITLSTAFEVQHLQKEVLVRYLNGKEKKEAIRPLIANHALTLGLSFCIGILFASMATESFKFLFVSIASLLALLAVSSCIYLTLTKLEIRKVFARSNYTGGYKAASFIVLSFITATMLLSLTFTFQAMSDASLTIRQEKNWSRFFDYENIYFMFRDETAMANSDKDQEYAFKFYNENIDRYDIQLSFDLANNGGVQQNERADSDNAFVYLNKNAISDLEIIGVDVSTLKDEKYYLISPWNKQELIAKNIYEEGNTDSDIHHLLAPSNDDTKDISVFPITIKTPYEFLVHDINMENLAHNYKKNPVIIVDTHDRLPDMEFSFNVFNSLVKFKDPGDFRAYMTRIGYAGEVYYKNSIKDLYMEKKAQKTLILLLNLMLSAMLVLLFVVTLSMVLKMDFEARAIEVALNKVLGKGVLKRYQGLFRMLSAGFFLGFALSCAYQAFTGAVRITFVFCGGALIVLLALIVTSSFIRKYEKRSISLILKGGVK